MKVNLHDEIEKDSLISHIVLNSLSKLMVEKLAARRKEDGSILCEIKLTIEDEEELDIEDFLNHWQSQVVEMVRKHAQKLVEEKLFDVCDSLYDLEQRIKRDINERLDDWEREENENEGNS